MNINIHDPKFNSIEVYLIEFNKIKSAQIDLEVTESIYEYTYMCVCTCVCMRGCVGVCVCVCRCVRGKNTESILK